MNTKSLKIKVELPNGTITTAPKDYETPPSAKVLQAEVDSFLANGEGFLSAYHFYVDRKTLRLHDASINVSARGKVLDVAHVENLEDSILIAAENDSSYDGIHDGFPTIVNPKGHLQVQYYHHGIAAMFRLGYKPYCTYSDENDFGKIVIDAGMDNVTGRPRKPLNKSTAPGYLRDTYSDWLKAAGIKGRLTKDNADQVVDTIRNYSTDRKPNCGQDFPLKNSSIKKILLDVADHKARSKNGFIDVDSTTLQGTIGSMVDDGSYPLGSLSSKIARNADGEVLMSVPNKKSLKGGFSEEAKKNTDDKAYHVVIPSSGMGSKGSQYTQNKFKAPKATIVPIYHNNTFDKKGADLLVSLYDNLVAERYNDGLEWRSTSARIKIDGKEPYGPILFAQQALPATAQAAGYPDEKPLMTWEDVCKCYEILLTKKKKELKATQDAIAKKQSESSKISALTLH